MKLLLASAIPLFIVGCKSVPPSASAAKSGPFTKVTFKNESKYEVYFSSGLAYRNSGLMGVSTNGAASVSSNEFFRRFESRSGEPEFYVLFVWEMSPPKTNTLEFPWLPLATGYVPSEVAARSDVEAIAKEDGLHVKAGASNRIWPWHRKPGAPQVRYMNRADLTRRNYAPKATQGWTANELIRREVAEVLLDKVESVELRFSIDERERLPIIVLNDPEAIAEIHEAFLRSERKKQLPVEPTGMGKVEDRVTFVDSSGIRTNFNLNNLQDDSYWGTRLFTLMKKYRARVASRLQL